MKNKVTAFFANDASAAFEKLNAEAGSHACVRLPCGDACGCCENLESLFFKPPTSPS